MAEAVAKAVAVERERWVNVSAAVEEVQVSRLGDERQRAAILRYVRENINQLRRYTYGKHIIVRLEKLTNEKF